MDAACPICGPCDENCRCTAREQDQYEEIQRLRLTDAEAEAIESAIKWIEYPDPENESMIYGYKSVVSILRDVLRRCS